MTTKEQIIETAYKFQGGFVDTDGAWSLCRNPKEFKGFLEREYGFIVTECAGTGYSSAIAYTEDGLLIAYNGYVRRKFAV